MTASKMDAGRFRWWLWWRLTRFRSVCPANAHARIIWRTREDTIKIDGTCRLDAANNGRCWCGKLGGEDAT